MPSNSTLPQEIIVDILSRLPANSIGRCRCVSKPWRSLLSQPQFIKTHLNRIREHPEESLILISDSHSLFSFTLNDAHHMFDEITHSAKKLSFAGHSGSWTEVVARCDGLVLIKDEEDKNFLISPTTREIGEVPISQFALDPNDAHHLFDEIDYSARKLSFSGHSDSWTEVVARCDGLVLIKDEEDKNFLISPTTRETREVPTSPFALDPRASFTMYGLGYDSVSDDYKVVTLSYYDTDNEHEPDCTEVFVNVYSVGNGTWKKADSSPYDHAVGHVTEGVFVDGYIHWLASRTEDYSSVIAAFDLVEEKFYEVPPPNSIECDKFVFNHLVVLGGCLGMFSSCSTETDIWVMKEYGVEESWTKITIIDPEGAEFRPLCLLGQEHVVLVKDEETVDEKLTMYNLKKGTSKNVFVHEFYDNLHAGGTFVKSLVSPHRSNETQTDH